MGDLQQRIFAMSGAILFFLTSIGLTVVVVFTMIQDSKKPKTDPAADLQANACQAPEGQIETLEAPEPFVSPDKVTELGVTDVVEANGQAAKAGDCLVMKYYGTLAANGELFDENFTQPNAFAFELGKGSVIQGWDQGLVGMKVGATRQLVIPAELGYGEQAMGEKIPANSDLVFVVKLLEIKK